MRSVLADDERRVFLCCIEVVDFAVELPCFICNRYKIFPPLEACFIIDQITTMAPLNKAN